MKVLVGNITNLSDARYCAGMGVDLLGFPLGHDPAEIPPSTFLEIAAWVTGPSIVLEYNTSMNKDELANVTTMEAFSHVRLSPQKWSENQQLFTGKPLILDTSLDEWDKISRDYNLPIAYLIIHDTLTEYNKTAIGELNKHIPVLIPFEPLHLNPEELTDLPVTGIVLEGTREDSPGIKDYEKLASVLEALEID